MLVSSKIQPRKNFPVTIISICSWKHRYVWKLTSKLLPEFIAATEFVVYVPETEIRKFKKITTTQFNILPQESLDCGFTESLKIAIKNSGNEGRFGWYLQQFYKIEALRRAKTERSAIWDADCVPTREIKLFDEIGNPLFMKAAEYNQEYFLTINKLIGLSRIENNSFVIPGFPIFKIWLEDFIKEVEANWNHKLWFEAILIATDLSKKSAFSETETLGTWISNKYSGQWKWHELNWERLGQSRFNYAKKLKPEKIISLGAKYDLDIISFENWDYRGFMSYWKFIKSKVSNFYSNSLMKSDFKLPRN